MDKEHILQEIKRTAQENGGNPLGWRRFESESGISDSEWRGKHWVRWNDALREAGFAPNQLSLAYQDVELLDKLARFARELGRLPVDGEMRIRARGNSDFPCTKTYRRLGRKSEIIGRMREYCIAHGQYEDVVEMCDAVHRMPDRSVRKGGRR